MPNPFFYGGRVEPDQFIGRRAELQRIFAGLEVAHTGQMQSFSVVGPRRIGKSSLLYYVANKYAQYLAQATNYRFAYVELQDARCKTLDGLLRTILESLKAPPTSDALTLVKFQSEIFKLKAAGVSSIICLDEFEELAYSTDEFNRDMYDSWRYLMSENAIAFITTSKVPLIELVETHGYTSPFFNVFTYLELGELTDDEARELIARGAECDRPFSPAEQDRALLLAGKHPYKIQLAGSIIYQAKTDNREWDWVMQEFKTQVKMAGLGQPNLRWAEESKPITRLTRFRSSSSILAFACYILAIALLIINRSSTEHQWVVIIAAVLVLTGIVLTLISFGVIPINDSERII
jgi:hypothetical protein